MTYINAMVEGSIQVHSQFNQLNMVFRNSPKRRGNQVADNLNMIVMLVNSGIMLARVQRRIHEATSLNIGNIPGMASVSWKSSRSRGMAVV